MFVWTISVILMDSMVLLLILVVIFALAIIVVAIVKLTVMNKNYLEKDELKMTKDGVGYQFKSGSEGLIANVNRLLRESSTSLRGLGISSDKITGNLRVVFGLFGASLIVLEVLIFAPAFYHLLHTTEGVSGLTVWGLIFIPITFGYLFLTAGITSRGMLNWKVVCVTIVLLLLSLVIDIWNSPVYNLDGSLREKPFGYVSGFEASTDYLLYHAIGSFFVLHINFTPIIVYVLVPMVFMSIVFGIAKLLRAEPKRLVET